MQAVPENTDGSARSAQRGGGNRGVIQALHRTHKAHRALLYRYLLSL